MKRKRKFGNYEAFKEYLHIMHTKALELMENLSEEDQRYLNNFFGRFYKTTKEHYWSLKKLFSMAMYIPMFLLIGISWKGRNFFDGLVYIDTHSGAGLAKIGTDERDVVLGSPLLAVLWPDIIAAKLKAFRKIQRGFDRLFFIERDLNTYKVLKRLVEHTKSQNISILLGDSNDLLMQIKSEIMSEFRRPLILLFIDPFGKFSTQIKLPILHNFVDGWSVDLIINIMSSFLARGFSSAAKNIKQFRDRVGELFGNLCEDENAQELQICMCYEGRQEKISPKDILDVYYFFLKKIGYVFIDSISVQYKNQALYHMIFASKAKGAKEWMRNYIEYLRSKTPEEYEILKNLWLQASGRQLSIMDLF